MQLDRKPSIPEGQPIRLEGPSTTFKEIRMRLYSTLCKMACRGRELKRQADLDFLALRRLPAVPAFWDGVLCKSGARRAGRPCRASVTLAQSCRGVQIG
jgi:hypothetical protein